ncbi:MAG TPA: hypothetical protein VKZ98_10045, partial [Aquaticitalea sp.]|nr:hypothetical protein [Aquaticitalea sp.]
MKLYLSMLMIILFANFSQAQNQVYTSLWKKVEKLENEGLPKSALEVVNKIASQAKKDNNAPQQIKTLLYQSKYAMTLDEQAQLKVMADFKNAIATSETPTKNILENMLATMYWQYYQQHRWRFYERTNTASKVDATDFQTWDLQTLFDEIHLHYQKSLENESVLQQTPLSGYDELLITQAGSKLFRPTLYDLLSHNALDFYTTDENSITTPSYKFEIDNVDYLNDFKTFATLDIGSKDSTSLQLHALKLFKKLIRFHEKQPFQLVDVDIKRLRFVHEHATFSNKDEQLIQTLKASRDQWGAHEVSALYDFEIASLYVEQSEAYDPKTHPELQWKNKEALAICEAVIKKFPKSKGAEKCAVLKERILQPSLSILSEDAIPIHKEGLMLVTYKNLTALDFKVYRITSSQRENFKNLYREDEQLAFIRQLQAQTTFHSNLKTEGDYQLHDMEIAFPELNNGIYLIVASKPDAAAKLFGHATFQVSNLGLVNISSNQQERFQIIDRNNGNPVEGAQVKLSYKRNYNGNTISEVKTTDKNGEFIINKDTNRLIGLTIEVTHQDDTAVFTNHYVNPYYRDNNDNKKKE